MFYGDLNGKEVKVESEKVGLKLNIQKTINCVKSNSIFCESLRVSGASLVAQLVKNLPAMQETPV